MTTSVGASDVPRTLLFRCDFNWWALMMRVSHPTGKLPADCSEASQSVECAELTGRVIIDGPRAWLETPQRQFIHRAWWALLSDN